jgi:hypothetical protein
MSKMNARGVKRVCQNEACGLPFYDLNRTDISCPNCGAAFDAKIVILPRGAVEPTSSWRRGPRTLPPVVAAPVVADDDASEVEVEATGDDEALETDAGELILEDEGDEEVADVLKPPLDDRAD